MDSGRHRPLQSHGYNAPTLLMLPLSSVCSISAHRSAQTRHNASGRPPPTCIPSSLPPALSSRGTTTARYHSPSFSRCTSNRCNPRVDVLYLTGAHTVPCVRARPLRTATRTNPPLTHSPHISADRVFPGLQVLMLNRNDISGDLNDPNVIKRFSQLPDLRYLELGNLPGLKGSLPVACTAPFKNLIHLGLSNTSVGGTLPACIVNNVHQLEIAGARFEGAFPEVTSLCALRYLIAGAPDRDDDSGAPRFSGQMPKLEYATHLHYANLDNHNFEGTLTLSNYIEVVRVESNHLTEVVLDKPQRLQVLDIAGNKISTLPDSVAQMTTMLAVHVDGNELKALPTSWRTPHLRDLTASLNKIEVRCCLWACVTRPPPPLLCCRLSLSCLCDMLMAGVLPSVVSASG